MPTVGVSLNQIVARTLDLLREVPGVSVQTYSEPRLQRLAQSVFDMVFEQHFIPDLSEWVTVVLDGSTGTPTSNLTVAKFTDIKNVYQQGKSKPLPLFPRTINPDTVTGTTPRYIEALRQPEAGSATKLFRVLPLAAEGSVTFYARFHPGDKTASPDSAALYIDKDLIAFGCTYMSLEQDGSNPGATDMYQGLFEQKLTRIIGGYGNLGVPLNAGEDDYPTEWVSV